MKLSQGVFLFFNVARQDMKCNKCGCDVTFNKQRDVSPPMILTRNKRPYCLNCAYLCHIIPDSLLCINKTSSVGNRGH